jgi:hypothetical protein
MRDCGFVPQPLGLSQMRDLEDGFGSTQCTQREGC